MPEMQRSIRRVRIEMDREFEKNPYQYNVEPIRGSLPLHVAIAMSLMGLALLVTVSSYAGGPQKSGNPIPYKPASAPGETEVLEPPAPAPVRRFTPGPDWTHVQGTTPSKPQPRKPAPTPVRKSDPCDLDCSYCDSLCGGSSGGQQQGGHGKSKLDHEFGEDSEYFNVAVWPYGRLKKRTSGAEGHLGLRLDTTTLSDDWGFQSDTGRAGVEVGGRVEKKVSRVILQGDARAHWVGGHTAYWALPSGDVVINNEAGAKGEVMVAITLLDPESTCNIYLGALARLNLVEDVSRDKLYATKDLGGEGGLKCDFAEGAVKLLIGVNGAVSWGDQLVTQSDLEKKMGFRTYIDLLDRLRLAGRTEYRYQSQVRDSELSAEFRNVGGGFYFRYSVELQKIPQLGSGTAVSAGPGSVDPVHHVVQQVVVGFGF